MVIFVCTNKTIIVVGNLPFMASFDVTIEAEFDSHKRTRPDSCAKSFLTPLL